MGHISGLQGVIFDLDGTLADTLPVCFAAFRAAFQEYAHRQFTDAEIDALFGPTEEGIIQQIVPENWKACHDTFLREYEKAHDLCPAPFPGILELLTQLHAQNILTAIVSGKGAGSAAISLRRLGLRAYFQTVETGSAQGVIKPQAIQKIIAGWNVAPDRVAYIGDAPADVTSARQAGVMALSAAWASTARVDRLEAMSPDALFRSVDAFASWLVRPADTPTNGNVEQGQNQAQIADRN